MIGYDQSIENAARGLASPAALLRRVSSLSSNRSVTPDHDDTIEAHYASLERGIPCGCLNGVVYIGHLVIGEDGDEVEVYEAVPCRRCADSR
jgi:hypothetical protein